MEITGSPFSMQISVNMWVWEVDIALPYVRTRSAITLPPLDNPVTSPEDGECTNVIPT